MTTTPQDKEATPVTQPDTWRDWLLAAWAVGIFGLFIRSVVELLS